MVKMILVSVFTFLLFGYGSAGATAYEEQYTPRFPDLGQRMSNGDSYYFGFDFVNLNSSPVGTNAQNLVLTSDAQGASGTITDATLKMTFYTDSANVGNESQIQLTAMSGSTPGNQTDLGTISFYVGFENYSQYYDYSHLLTPAELAALGLLSSENWDQVMITPNYVVNSPLLLQKVEMDITTASIGVTAVPELATAGLLGIGLVGLTGVKRRVEE